MENYKEMYEQLLAEFQQYKKESIKWSVQDFTLYDHPTHFVTEEQAQKILEIMVSHHDSEYGISWRDVAYYIEEYGTEKE